MSFVAYLVSPFSHTHENEFFRYMVRELRQRFESSEGKVVLVGNATCNNHEMDAIFIKSGQITVIEFKDYSGKLEFSENNPWKIYKNNNLVFVRGGGTINPFHQVRAYRYSLTNFFKDKSSEIIQNKDVERKWEYINTVVAFSGFIEFEKEAIPPNVRKYFHIVDKSGLIDLLEDINSSELFLTDDEINRILRVLDIRPENLYGGKIWVESSKRTSNKINLKLVEKLLPDKKENSESWRILNFYRTLINIERHKEFQRSNDDLYKYPIDWDDIRNNMKEKFEVDLKGNSDFYNIFVDNMRQNFPKNLFVGVNVLFNNKETPLFFNLILSSELSRSQRYISVNIKDLELNKEVLEQFEPGEEIIEELSSEVERAKSLDEKIQVIKNKLGISINLVDTISLGLSEANNYTAQLVSELKRLSENFIDTDEHGIFEGFLFNSYVSSKEKQGSFDKFIKITPLNTHQEEALKASFQQPLTVVTGPPGTGKSQLVINLIGNAIVNGKSVLFASKNNKAVDTVKERVNGIFKEHYLLRFGSKSAIREDTKILIERFINESRRIKQENVHINWAELEEDLRSAVKRMNEVRLNLHEIKIREERVKGLKNKISELENKRIEFISNLGKIYYDILVKNKYSIDVNSSEVLNILQLVNSYHTNLIRKIIFKIFRKNILKNITNKVKSIHRKLDEDVFQFIIDKAPIMEGENCNLGDLINHLKYCCDFIDRFESAKGEYSKILKEISALSKEFDKEKRTLDPLLVEKPKLLENLDRLEREFIRLSKQYLNGKIQEKIRNINVNEVRRYLEYIPDGIPWEKELIPKYEITCRNFLKDFKAVSITNLSIKNAFSLTKGLFDILIVDEASQCDIASALPLLYRAKSAVIIGDPLQLKHITCVKKEEQNYVAEYFKVNEYNLNYVDNSLFDFARGIADKSELNTYFLREHYRCHPEIVEFSNRCYYGPKLGQEMVVKTIPSNFKYGDIGIYWHNVSGQVHSEKNINIQEASYAIKLAEKLVNKYPDATIGIVTPFRHQSEHLKAITRDFLKEKIQIDTVHKYQGDERDIIILSLVVTYGCRPSLVDFINRRSNYLLNVAVTRARSSLYVIGDFNYCRNLENHGSETPFLKSLAEYIESIGKVVFN